MLIWLIVHNFIALVRYRGDKQLRHRCRVLLSPRRRRDISAISDVAAAFQPRYRGFISFLSVVAATGRRDIFYRVPLSPRRRRDSRCRSCSPAATSRCHVEWGLRDRPRETFYSPPKSNKTISQPIIAPYWPNQSNLCYATQGYD